MMGHGIFLLMGGKSTWVHVGKAMAHFGIVSYPMFWGVAAALVQTVCGLFFALGLFFRISCFLLLGTMFVAFMSHWYAHDPFFTVTSHSLKLVIAFAAFLFIGPGDYAVRD
ncbi:MAG: hypothetical protein Tsb0018_12830 [Opitutales bacterium]